ncbi:MAG: asparagine synthase (glutamine-hydrolyzing) [Chlamydiales bacterium]|nr:asparagine synthase (glutamine-hydrolyzing) [Chlamydiia bacterium]MCP5507690.1 asparagine synthase (glutamine-hydrolyzing) [Chlamydiales bacterium]
MKGLAGIVYPDVFQVNHLIQPMIDVIQCGDGAIRDLHTYNNIQIATSGSKLAVNEKKTIIGGIEGEIYNTKELEKKLKQQGYHFRTGTAAELVVHAYEHWGVSFVEKLDGEFAIMILDPHQELILIVRDRIGKKPLYWYHDDHHFLFSTHLKAILATGAVPLSPADDALSSYLYFGYFPQDLTPVKEVSKLLPGHYLLFRFNNSKSIESYWSYSSFFEKPLQKHKNVIAKQLDSELQASTKKRVEGRNSVGCFVSGGLGSATAAYYVQKEMHTEGLPAFSVAFQGENEEDLEASGIVCNRLNLACHKKLITPEEYLDHLSEIVWHLDEPLADPNIVATWQLAGMAAEKVNTVFSGMGSDELLAGHNRYTVNEQRISMPVRMLHLSKQLAYSVLIPFLNRINPSTAFRMLKESRTNPWQYEYLRQNALFDESMMRSASPKLAGLFDPEVFLHKFYHLSRVQSRVSSFLYFDVKTRLADCYIFQYEKLTQARNLTWMSPFLDQELIEYLAGLPEPEELSINETASVLKVLLKNIYPEQFVNRPKVTRKALLASWVELSGLSGVFEKLKTGTLMEIGLLSKSWLDKVLATPKSRQLHFRYLWALLILEVWFRLFINRAIEPRTPKMPIEILLTEQ